MAAKPKYAEDPTPITHGKQAWEYDLVFLAGTDGEVLAELNNAGAEGWEVVGSIKAAVLLKRPAVMQPASTDDDAAAGDEEASDA